MVTVQQPLVSEFIITGKLTDLLVNGKGCVTYLYLTTPEADFAIAVAKSPTSNINQHLQPGCYLKVTGMRKYKLHQDQLEYKAYTIELLSEQVSQSINNQDKIKNAKPALKVLFCQNSNCWNKGGKVASEALRMKLRSQGTIDQVEIKTIGCLKQCKQAPNLVIMPEGNRYSRVQPEQLSTLITKQLRSKN